MMDKSTFKDGFLSVFARFSGFLAILKSLKDPGNLGVGVGVLATFIIHGTLFLGYFYIIKVLF